MNWGEELWDQYDNIASHTNKGIELLDKYGQMTKEISAIETEYASKLRRVVKNYYVKKKDEEDNFFTTIQAFNKVLSEMGDIAGQHETIAEELQLQIGKDITTLIKELKDERKRHLQEGSKLQNALQASINGLEKSRKSYDKCFRESEKAHESYRKADADLNLSRAELEKAKTISHTKSQMCEAAKTDYASHLQQTNDLQKRHYHELMPRVFKQLQDMEERRAQCLRNYIQHSAHIRRRVLPIIDKCVDGQIEASNLIDPLEDSKLVIEKYKSGMIPPGDFPFEDLSTLNGRTSDSDSLNVDSTDNIHSSGNHTSRGSTSLHYSRSDTFRGTLSAAKFRKRGGLFSIFGSNKADVDDSKDDFSNLPPNQRKKRLQKEIDQITNSIKQEKAVMEALLKMKRTYTDNPNLGDPDALKNQFFENQRKLEKLDQDLKKFQNLLDDVINNTPTFAIKKGSISSSSNQSIEATSASRHRNSLSDESLSRSESETSVNNTNTPTNSTPVSSANNKTTSMLGDGGLNRFTPSDSSQSLTSPNGGITTRNMFTNGMLGAISKSPVSNESEKSASHISTPEGEYQDANSTRSNANSADEEEEEEFQVLGTARALYPFEGQDEGSIKMVEGEELDVIESDQGDGWTRVRRPNTFDEGFVPTTYIEITLLDQIKGANESCASSQPVTHLAKC